MNIELSSSSKLPTKNNVLKMCRMFMYIAFRCGVSTINTNKTDRVGQLGEYGE